MNDQQQPIIHTITNPNQLPGGGLYRAIQFDTKEKAEQYPAEAWLFESQIIKAFYLFIPATEQA